ncbi:RICIN domain-containing protein [Burkholderia alba]|uniref:RICIN domain-containing protein n=1 Tax=Burkholderia alba TaxID=2683677 RepID=UPI002B05463F|nr:RICIN domain-containing protein [Burkholderia alba]
MKRSGNRISFTALGAALLMLFQAAPAQAFTFSAAAPVSASPYSDSPNAFFIDRDGTFFLQNAYAQYDDVPADHVWNFYTGANADAVSLSAAHSQYDTRTLCNDGNPVAQALFGQPVKSQTGYSQADYCDMIGVWVDPDTGNWYGLVHNELFGNNPRVDAISYAVSTDRGASWTLQQPILTSPYGKGDPNTPYYYYGDGDPRLFVDYASGYFYVFYTSRILGQNGNPSGFDNYMWAHAARAPIGQKMTPSSWQKFYDGKWQQAPGTNWTCDASTAGSIPCAAAPVSSSLEANLQGPSTDLSAQGGPAADTTGGETFVTPGKNAGSLYNAGYTNGTLRVMSVSWNVYLQKYIAMAEDRTVSNPGTPNFDYGLPATTLKFYVSSDLGTPQWTYAGSVPYNSASWYRWFVDSATKTSSSALGKTFRAYCGFGCSKYGSEYVDVTAAVAQPADAAPVYYSDASGHSIGAGTAVRRYFIAHPGNPATNLPSAAAGAWQFAATGDGFFTIAINGTYLGVKDGNAGRAWGAPVVLSKAAPAASAARQQWYFQKVAGAGGAAFRIVNRYSGLALSFPGSALTTDLSTAVTAPLRNWDAAAPASIQVWKQSDQAIVLQ